MDVNDKLITGTKFTCVLIELPYSLPSMMKLFHDLLFIYLHSRIGIIIISISCMMENNNYSIFCIV